MDGDQLLRIFKRERTQQNRIDDGEQGRVRADSQAKSKNGNAGKAWALQQLPQRVPKILHQSVHDSFLTRFVMPLRDRLWSRGKPGPYTREKRSDTTPPSPPRK